MALESPEPLNPNEIDLLASLMARLPNGRLPYPIWRENMRLNVAPSYEVVPILPGETTKVLLFQRPAKDKDYPSQWHAPGTMIMTTDVQGESFNETWRRLKTTELQGVDCGDNRPVQVHSDLVDSPRGTALLVVNYLVLRSDMIGDNGKFFDANCLPQEIVTSHRDVIIPRAVSAFEKKILK